CARVTNRSFFHAGALFALVFAWKAILVLFFALPPPSNDSFFYDGPVVNWLENGHYSNPSLRQVLPISGTEVFSAYPPLYQAALFGWLSFFGTTAFSAMVFHLGLFGVYLLTLFRLFRKLEITSNAGIIGGLFLFAI